MYCTAAVYRWAPFRAGFGAQLSTCHLAAIAAVESHPGLPMSLPPCLPPCLPVCLAVYLCRDLDMRAYLSSAVLRSRFRLPPPPPQQQSDAAGEEGGVRRTRSGAALGSRWA